ncbi:hypothetical protein [Pseudidiomarina terrestris]|uniref:Uncharacterized protein n=1 Tax=Pseudidiomarina terrestris TaxID=2820060 RepID=A0AAW7R130_9GAMM|nr:MULTISPECIES: hypothetical protein [unclassified Pseudidiomarina]MDN7125003.1 hypothetical protein [Pseudidiomarina sp. 1APP75-32.1]MDN7129522.1 hypothetical protein [Pseudidiomarina sp. 1APR75-15]MDN7135836.1 hypothetical protein [Pseudidiomarina sp. 1ASP75-5]MEA3588000.1 hypothetical protein [Pseudidiomarina sp. 1APP75-27a]
MQLRLQLQRQRKRVASGFVVASLMLGAVLFTDVGQSTLTASEKDCQKLLQNSEQPEVMQQCANRIMQNELSWSSWFSGHSRSTQFHFLDLFELLFSDSRQDQSDYSSNKKVSLS